MEQVARVCAHVWKLLAQAMNVPLQDKALCLYLTLPPSSSPFLSLFFPPSSSLPSSNIEALDTHPCRHWDGKRRWRQYKDEAEGESLQGARGSEGSRACKQTQCSQNWGGVLRPPPPELRQELISAQGRAGWTAHDQT